MGVLQRPGSGENLGRFSSRLRNTLASKAKPFGLWSVPESAAGPQDEDCPYEMETQSYAEESQMLMDEDIEDEVDADWAKIKSVPDRVPEAVYHGETGSRASMGKCLR